MRTQIMSVHGWRKKLFKFEQYMNSCILEVEFLFQLQHGWRCDDIVAIIIQLFQVFSVSFFSSFLGILCLPSIHVILFYHISSYMRTFTSLKRNTTHFQLLHFTKGSSSVVLFLSPAILRWYLDSLVKCRRFLP